MNTILKLAAAAAALTALSACDMLGGGGDSAGNKETTVNVSSDNASGAATNGSADTGGKDPAAAGNASAAAPSSGQVTREFLIGRWTDNNDCNNTITFAADGTFTVPGGRGGVWVLDGDRLTFSGGAGSRSARVQAPNADTIMLINEDGSVGRSTRCTS